MHKPVVHRIDRHMKNVMKTYSVRFQPQYQAGRDFVGKNAKRDATAWAKKTEAEIHANMGDSRAKATIVAKATA